MSEMPTVRGEIATIARDARATLLPGFEGTTLPGWLAARLRDGLGGVCLFRTNVESRAQLRELTDAIRAANPLAVIAIDEEGGDVTRLYQALGSPYPGNAILGRIDDESYTEFVAATVGWELRNAGVTVDFAPDVDINSNENNPVIGVRSFGAEPAEVARHSAAWVRGLEATGIAASAKHFPGHGDTAQDSHLALPVVDVPLETLRERELLPFVAAIGAGVRTIMSSHILLPQLDADNPATFSSTILQELLRDDLGFHGVIVSDALDMAGASGEIGIPEAAVRAIAAGCDLLCIGTKNTEDQLAEIEATIVAAIEAGRLSTDRLADAAARVRALAVGLETDRRDIPIPEYALTGAEPVFDPYRTLAAFDIRPGLTVPVDRILVKLQTAANIAVGDAPWGDGSQAPAAITVRSGEAIELPPGVTPVVIGRDNHRHDWVRAAIDDLRARHPQTVVVDMGWPAADRRYADVATFGASRHAADTLLVWLDAAANDTTKEETR